MFADRDAAGRALVPRLTALRLEEPVVLALPRGGVAVASPVAAALGVPVHLLLVRKLGAPDNPELAIGAAVEGEPPQVVLNDDVIAALGVGSDWIVRERERALDELARRRARFPLGRPPPLRGRTAVVVDDGVATGATAAAALAGLARAGASRVVLAVPVIAAEIAARFRAGGTEVLAGVEPRDLRSVGAFYRDFHQLEDTEVLALLD